MVSIATQNICPQEHLQVIKSGKCIGKLKIFPQISFILSSYWCWDYFVLFTMSYLVIEGGASNLRLINGLCNWQKSILWPYLVGFLPITLISFTKLRFRRSFWGDEQVWILVGSKVMTQSANIFISTPVANLMHHPIRIFLQTYILWFFLCVVGQNCLIP